MKKYYILFLYTALALVAAACGKEKEIGPNEETQRFVEAWMLVHYPEIQPTELGAYVLEYDSVDDKDAKEVIIDTGHVYVSYTVTDLKGNITSYTEAEQATQLREYDRTYYYGPGFWSTSKTSTIAGLIEAMKGMKVGERKKVMIPRWLQTYKDTDLAGYLATSSSGSESIYDFTIVDYTKDVNQWQRDSIIRWISGYVDENGSKWELPEKLDTNFFFHTINPGVIPATEGDEEEEEEWKMPKDTTVYINYTGMLLNGQVFDTTIERVAKDNYIYSSSTEYTPKPVSWGEKASELKLNSNSVISGFSQILWQMRPGEKAVGVFTSALGYTSSGSGRRIPGYSPLLFEIELVDKPE